MGGRVLTILAATYATALLQAGLWYAWTHSLWPAALPSGLALDLVALALASAWIALLTVAIRKHGRFGLLALPGAPLALLPPLLMFALYSACYFEGNCL